MTSHVSRAIPVAVCVALLLGGFAETSVAAGPPRTGSGTGVITSFQILSNREVGGNHIQERRLEGTLEGTLQGTFVEHASGIIHRDGLVTFQATFEFTGTVEGCAGSPGTLHAALSGQGQAGAPVTDANFRVVDQSSNTLAVTGTGRMRQAGPDIVYEIQYVCR